MACLKRSARNVGGPLHSGGGKVSVWHANPEARQGKQWYAACSGNTGRTVGPDTPVPTSLRGIAAGLAGAEASIAEEPGAGKLHAGIYEGAPGNRHL